MNQDYIEDIAELEKTNPDMVDLRWHEIQPEGNTRVGNTAATASQISGSKMLFKVDISTNRRFLIAQSFFRSRFKISDAGGLPIALSDHMGIAMGFQDCLYEYAGVVLGSVVIEEITNHLPQIAAIRKRLYNSKAWLDTAGNSNFWESSLEDRVNTLSIDGLNPMKPGGTTYTVNPFGVKTIAFTFGTVGSGLGTIAISAAQDIVPNLEVGDYLITAAEVAPGHRITEITYNELSTGRTYNTIRATGTEDRAASAVTKWSKEYPTMGLQDFETVWQPPLAIFDTGYALPVGNWRLDLKFHADWQKNFIQGMQAKVITTDYLVTIIDVKYFYPTTIGENITDKKYILPLKSIYIDSQPRTSSAAGNNTVNFIVKPSTYMLTAALQDTRVFSDSRICPTQFKSLNKYEKDLKNLQIKYNNIIFPENPTDMLGTAFNDNLTKYYMKTYYDNIIASGAFYDNGGVETFKEWMERGPIFHAKFFKEKDNNATSVQVVTEFNNAVYDLAIVLASHYTHDITVDIVGGVVRSAVPRVR